MHRLCAIVTLAICHRRVFSRGLSKSELAKLDGHLVFGNAIDDSVAVYPRDKEAWTKSDALWSYTLEKGKDGLHQKFGGKMNDVKRVVNRHGEICLLIVAHGPGIALYNMETGVFDFSWEPKTSSGDTMATHTAELLPDGNFAVADPDDHGSSSILIISGDNSNPKILDTVSFNGIHGTVWDQDREILWAWGGQLKHYKYQDGKLSHETKIANLPDWAHGGHDLAAMDGEHKLIFTSGGGVGTYDINKDKFELAYDIGSGKGIAYDHLTKEFAFCKHDSPSSSFRTFQIRNPLKPKWIFSPHDKMAMYKARFFRDSPFSYPSQSPTPSPPAPVPTPPAPTPGPSPAGADTLLAGSKLKSGEFLVSASSDVTLKMTSGGELVLKYVGSNYWSSGTSGHDGAYLSFQASGPKLLIRDADSTVLWDETGKVSGATRAVVQDDCDFVLTDDSGEELWNLGSSCPSPLQSFNYSSSVVV